MQSYHIPIWKTAPFLRLILPLIAGILLQWYQQPSLSFILFAGSSFLIAFILFYFLPLSVRFRFRNLQGAVLVLFLSFFGMFACWQKDIRHQPLWFGQKLSDSSSFVVRINEPLVEKTKSYKAEGVVEMLMNPSGAMRVHGKIFIYFTKDSVAASLAYGDRILIRKSVQQIKNSGNPGAFNYERYAAFQQTFHTVYLKKTDWCILDSGNTNSLKKFVFFLRTNVVNMLKQNISGDKNVLGIAEALLIGYKEDLDKDLVQAYSNAGVVHIIAISGLHLGLIYVMLVWLFERLPFVKKQKFLKVILILGCLWLFSLLTGASASVLRSAVMFTCIVIGKNFFRQASIYNSLAASAFMLLCYDPYFLWDVGFQLSYLAVIGIVALQKPFCNLLYFKNTWLNKCWNMLAITCAAQLITFPLCLYYFHQFPTLFFITNLVAVPLSTIILFAEIFLIAFSWLPVIALYTGKITGGLIWVMNLFIETCNSVPGSLLDNIYADVFSTWLLYALIVCVCSWLINKQKKYFRFALLSLLLFTSFISAVKFKLVYQKKLIIYNVPQHQAIDFVYQDLYYFKGDTGMLADGPLRNFHLKPARIALQATEQVNLMPHLYQKNEAWIFFEKQLLIIDTAVSFQPLQSRVKIDILLISKNPRLDINNIAGAVEPAIIVMDASNSLWKIAEWKKQCLALALPYFSIPEKGAFMMDLK